MKELIKDQRLALQEVRKAMYGRLRNLGFTEGMLRDKSLFQMLNLLHLLVGHFNYIGMFSHTCALLEELFGTDAFWDKPEKIEEPTPEQPRLRVN